MKNRAQGVAALLNNWDKAKEALQDSINAEGSAQAENEKYMQSIEAHQAQLRNAWGEVWTNAINRDTVNFFVDLGKGILVVVKNLGLLKSVFAAIGGIGGAVFGARNRGFVKTVYDSQGSAGLQWFGSKDIRTAVKNFFILNAEKIKPIVSEEVFKQYQRDFSQKDWVKKRNPKSGLSFTPSEKAYDTWKLAHRSDSYGYKDYVNDLKSENIQTKAFSIQTVGAKAATLLFNTALSTLATVGISLAITGIAKLITRHEDISKAATEAKEKISKLNEEYRNTSEYVESNTEKYIQLSKGVSENGENLSLSSENYKEFLDINNKLAEAFPTLTRVYDENGNAIVNLGGNASETSAKLKELLEMERQIANQKIVDSIPDVLKGAEQDFRDNFNLIHVETENKNDLEKKFEDYKGSQQKIYDNLQDLYSGRSIFTSSLEETHEYAELLKNLGLYGKYVSGIYGDNGGAEFNLAFNVTDEDIEQAKKRQEVVINDFMSDIDQQVRDANTNIAKKKSENKTVNNSIKSVIAPWLQTSVSEDISKETKDILLDIVNNIDYADLYDKGKITGGFKNLTKYLDENLIRVMDNANIGSSFTNMVNAKTDFSQGKKSIREYAAQYKELLDTVETASGKDSGTYSMFSNVFGEDSVSQLKIYNDLVGKYKQDVVDAIKESDEAIITNSNDSVGLYKAFESAGSSAADTWSMVADYLRQTSSIVGDSIKDLSSDQRLLSSSTDALTEAINEQNTSGYVSVDTITKVQKQMSALGLSTEDFGKTLEMTGNGVRLNTDALKRTVDLHANRHVNQINAAYQQLDKTYQEQSYTLEVLKKSQDANTEAGKQAIKNQQDKVDAITAEIANLDKLKAEYEEYTDVYSKFQNALSTANQGARYDNMRGQKDSIDKLVKNSQYGVDEVEAYTEYYTGHDTSSDNYTESKKWYTTASSNASKYNTENIQGLLNLRNAITDNGKASKESAAYMEGNELVINNIKDAAQKAGVSVSFLADALNKLPEFKIDVNYDQSQVIEASKEELAEEAKALENSLINFKAEKFLREQNGLSTEDIDASIDAIQKKLEDTNFEINIDTNAMDIMTQVVNLENKLKEAETLLNKDSNNGDALKQKQIVLDELNRLDKENPNLNIKATVEADMEKFHSDMKNGEDETSKLSADMQKLQDQLNKGAKFDINGNAVQTLATIDNYIKRLPKEPKVIDIEVNKKYSNAYSESSGSSNSISSSGTAHVDGTLNTGKNGDTLVGELGQELVVDRSTGTWRTVGDNGAEFTDIKKNDIVFNAEQTKDLLSKGYTKTRGKALVGGNAFAGGTINSASTSSRGTTMEAILKDQNNAAKENTKATKKNTKASEDIVKEFDWLERSMAVQEKQTSSHRTEAENTYNSNESRLSWYSATVELDKKEIEIAKQIEQRRTEDWNKYTEKIKETFGAGADQFISNIEHGNFNFDEWLTTRTLPAQASDTDKKNFEKQNEVIEKAIQAFDSWQEATDRITSKQKQLLDDQKALYELQIRSIQNTIDAIQSKIESIQSNITLKQTSGNIVTAADYKAMIAQSKSSVESYNNLISSYEDRLGELDEGSEEYREVYNSIIQAQSAIRQAKEQQAEWNEAIKQMPITHIESYIENLKSVQEDLSNYISELEAQGKKVTADVIKQQMDLQSSIAQQYHKEIELVEKNLSTYTPGRITALVHSDVYCRE